MIQLPPSPPLDPWASFDEYDNDRPAGDQAQAQAGPSCSPTVTRTRTKTPPHPLHTTDLLHPLPHHSKNGSLDVLSDVSRPALMRLTSETERQVAESSRSGSERGSLDLLRMSTANANAGAEEVEVLIHKVKADESMPGIALLYGIDVATLRKINKLWASDPVHLRTHLYVPLEACKWQKARDTFTRGPGEGQVTLTAKDTRNKGKGKGRQEASPKLVDVDYDAWEDSAKEFMPSTNLNYGRSNSLDNGNGRLSIDGGIEEEEAEPSVRILDIVRIPRSQLQFFPKQKPPDSRKSLDSPLRNSTSYSSRHPPRRASQQSDGPSISNDLSTLPSPLQPRIPTPNKPVSKVVRLRPPSGFTPGPIVPSATDTFVNRLSSLFTVPPPPPTTSQPFGSRKTSLASANPSKAGSGASSPSHSAGHQDVSLELRPRSSFEVPRRNGHGHASHRTASESKKFD